MSFVIKRYLATVPEKRKEKIKILHQLIMECYPGVSIDLKYKMPTYSYDAGWVAIANQKNYVSLYTCSARHLEQFKAAYPQIKTGKGCINFRDRDEIPDQAIKAVIRLAIEHPATSG